MLLWVTNILSSNPGEINLRFTGKCGIAVSVDCRRMHIPSFLFSHSSKVLYVSCVRWNLHENNVKIVLDIIIQVIASTCKSIALTIS